MRFKEKADASIARALIVMAIILVAAVVRILPHPWNFTPIGALALFAGATVRGRWQKYALPLAALFAGDLLIGLYGLIAVVYASFLVSVFIGTWLEKRRTVWKIGGATLLGAVQFFLVTNFAVWAFLGSYKPSLSGLAACYAAGIPLFWNTLGGDAMYAALFFGGLALAERLIPAVRQAESEPVR
jgi:hypothetical protein